MSTKSAKRSVETEEYLKMVARMVRGAGRRVADADEVELRQLIALRNVLESAIKDAVKGQRETYNRSWEYIAQATGTTRQAAFARYSK